MHEIARACDPGQARKAAQPPAESAIPKDDHANARFGERPHVDVDLPAGERDAIASAGQLAGEMHALLLHPRSSEVVHHHERRARRGAVSTLGVAVHASNAARTAWWSTVGSRSTRWWLAVTRARAPGTSPADSTVTMSPSSARRRVSSAW